LTRLHTDQIRVCTQDGHLADTALHPGFQAFLPRIECGRFVQLVAAPTVRKPVTVGASRGLILSAAQLLAHCP
jgi:hypothetical protein